MVQGSRITTNFTLRVNGIDLTGKVKSVKPPSIKNQTENYRPGGYLAPVARKLGLQPIEFEFTLFDCNPSLLSLSGLDNGNEISFILRQFIESEDGSKHTLITTGSGESIDEDIGSIENEQMSEDTYMYILNNVRREYDGQLIREVDVRRGIDRLGSNAGAIIDQALELRRILQIGQNL
mgnify:CR=1 FL=1